MKTVGRHFVRISICAAAVLGTFFLTASLSRFSRQVEQNQYDQNLIQLLDQASYNASLVKNYLDLSFQVLEGFSLLFSGFDDIHSKESLNLVKNLVQKTEFEVLAVSDVDGTAYFSDGTFMNISYREYFRQALSGSRYISRLLLSSKSGKKMFVLSVPVIKDGKVRGIVSGLCDVKSFAEKINFRSFRGNSFSYVIQDSGEIVVYARNVQSLLMPDNMYDFFDKAQFHGGLSASALISEISSGAKNHAVIEVSGEDWILCYRPTGVSGWNFIAVLPLSFINDFTQQITFHGYMLAVKFAVVFILILLLMLLYGKVSRQYLVGLNQKLKAKSDQISLGMSSSCIAVFEYDIDERILTFSGESGARRGLPPVMSDVPESLIHGGYVHSDYEDELRSVFSEINGGRENAGAVIKMKCGADSDFEWFKFTLTNIFDEKKNILHTVGVVENIHEQKNYENMLRERAEHDLLTGLYNRITAETLISAFLMQNNQSSHLHAMLVIDLDNFKLINDRCGHIVGDEVLRKAARVLINTFRSSDILGRLGGDEFTVFMKDCDSVSHVCSRAQELLSGLSVLSVPGFPHMSVHASIGIVLVPEGLTDFTEIYRRADKALYAAKNGGKNRYNLYSEREREAIKYS